MQMHNVSQQQFRIYRYLLPGTVDDLRHAISLVYRCDQEGKLYYCQSVTGTAQRPRCLSNAYAYVRLRAFPPTLLAMAPR